MHDATGEEPAEVPLGNIRRDDDGSLVCETLEKARHGLEVCS